MQSGKILMLIGLGLFLLGGLIFLAGYFGLPLGHLPGDFRIQRDNFTCIFPLTTMVVLSVLLSIGLNLILRLWKK